MTQPREWFRPQYGKPLTPDEMARLFADFDYNQACWDRRKAEIEAEEAAAKATK